MKAARCVGLVVAVVSAVLPLHTASAAETSTTAIRQRQIGQQIAGLRSQVAEASAEEGRLLDELDAADARVRELSGRVGALDADIVAARADRDAAQARLDGLEVRYLEARDRYEATRDALGRARDELRARALAAYTEGPLLAGYTDAILNGGVRDLAARSGYLGSIAAERARVVERYRLLRDEIGGEEAALEQSRAAALAQRDVVAGRAARLEVARASQDAIRQQVIAQTRQRAQVLAEVRGRRAEFEAEIAALRRESSSIAALLRSRQAGQGLRPSGHGVLALPIPGAPITSPFGPRVHPIFGDVRMHTGIDLGADYGTPILAAADGVVVSAGPLGGYGNATVIDHGNRLATLYAHQSAFVVSAGDRVTRGQVVGYVGATGYATGPHLHFEVRVSGTPVDPMDYL